MPDQPQLNEREWFDTLTGARVRIKTPGAETDNRVTIIEFVEPANSQPPIFTRHEFIEVFCVVDGVLTFQFLDEPQFEISTGQNITCPGWKPHSFWNETNKPVSVQLVCTPAGLDEFFIQSHLLLEKYSDYESDDQKLTTAMKALRTRFGLEHVGTPPTKR